ncbi:unnamed protein product [Schistocephalus solidus]|uniref:Uncharacterized protein n=1 Tax=Schistocephalus solidus TaxID=70667 RepID=A0A183T1R0_SCHSO|nr:unnamed protein product [Schistocephalus solidus]
MENAALKRQLLISGASKATPSCLPVGPLSNSLTPVTSVSKQPPCSTSSDMLPKTSTFMRSASDSQHSCHISFRKSAAPAPPPATNVCKQASLQLPKNGSTEEAGNWRQDGTSRSTRRHSSFNALDCRGKPRRSLPTFTRVNWCLQRRYCREEEVVDDDHAAGVSNAHTSCGKSSIFLAVKNVCIHSNLSSPARRPHPLSGWCSSATSGTSSQSALSPSHRSSSSTTAASTCGRNISRSPSSEPTKPT